MERNKLPVLVALVHILLIFVAIPWSIRAGMAGTTTYNWELGIAVSVATLVGIDVWLLRRNKIPGGAIFVGQIFLVLGTIIATLSLLGLILPDLVSYSLEPSDFVGMVVFGFGVCCILAYYTMFKLWEEKK